MDESQLTIFASLISFVIHQQTQILLYTIILGEIIGHNRFKCVNYILLFHIIFPIMTIIFPILCPIISTQTIIFPIIFPIIRYYFTHLYINSYYFRVLVKRPS